MIDVSDDLPAVLQAGGFTRSFVANLVVDGETVLEDVPLVGCEVSSDGTARIRGQVSATLQYSDEIGQSVVPETLTSWLTPYASYLDVSMRIATGGFSEKVLRGTYKVIGVGDASAKRVTVGPRIVTLGSSVKLTLADAFRVTDREDFPVPSGPSSLLSAWAEIGLLTGLPLYRNVADSPIIRAVTYQENRLDAVFDLASILGGTPYMSPLNQVTIQPDVWGSPTDEIMMGPDGTATAIDIDDLTDDNIFNQVVVRSHDDTQSIVLATAQIATGPLRYGGPFGRIPYFASSQYVTTPAQAQAYANSLLPQVSAQPATPYSISCLPDPRREVGDVVPFEKDGRTLLGRIQSLKLPDRGLMTMKVLVNNG